MPKRRITGASLPWFGLQWDEVDSDADVVRRVVGFLDDRRVLYEPLNAQLFDYVGRSVKEIRVMLTRELAGGPDARELIWCLKEMRAALRKLNTELERIEQSDSGERRNTRELQVLALGEMRGRVNPMVALLASKYKIEVEEDLAAELERSEDDA